MVSHAVDGVNDVGTKFAAETIIASGSGSIDRNDVDAIASDDTQGEQRERGSGANAPDSSLSASEASAPDASEASGGSGGDVPPTPKFPGRCAAGGGSKSRS